MEHDIILSDIIPALICHPTKGRTITKANHAHAPEGKRINALSMSRGHGIILSDIIPAPVRCPTEEDIFLDEPCTSPGGTWTKDMIVSLWKHSGTIYQR